MAYAWMPWLTGAVLLATRVAGMIVLIPWWGGRVFPARVKLGLVLALTIALLPSALAAQAVPADLLQTFFLLPGELLLGLGLGAGVRMVLGGLASAGRVAAMQIGLRMANVLDPAGGHQASVVDAVLHGVTVMAMLACELHHLILRGLHRTIELLPLGGQGWEVESLHQLVLRGGQVLWILCAQVAGPVIAVALMMHVALAVLVRFAPQMNVFFVAFALVILVGLVFLASMLPFAVTRALALGEEQVAMFFTVFAR